MKSSSAQPRQPDMLPNGMPPVTRLRTSLARQVTLHPTERTTEPVQRHRRPAKPLFFMTTGVVIVCGMVIFWQQVVTPWWTGLQDQWNYGNAHITQLDADVGHNGLSHFIAEYSRGDIVVIEISYANPNDSHVYTLTGMMSSQAKPVVLLNTARDVHTGRIDLVIDVEGSGFQTVLYNTGSSFSQTGA